MSKDQHVTSNSSTELNIIKALEFVGDNSTYQKKRLLLASIIILNFAILTSKIPFMGPQIIILYFLACGFGQFVSIIYFSVKQIAFFIFISAFLASVLYPFSEFMTSLSYLSLGFFTKGFFGKALIYINEIGGQRFKAWSITVIFAICGLSTLVSAMQKVLKIPVWIWYYGLIFIPMLVASFLILKLWKRSPYDYYQKSTFQFMQDLYKQAKQVLNQIAIENQRPPFQYSLEGQRQYDEFLQSNKHSYFKIINQPVLRKITVPLIMIWVFKEFVYYGSYTLVPELTHEYNKSYILMSISQTFAVLMSYPIRLKIRRVNAIFGLIFIIAVASLMSSFKVVPQECMPKDKKCSIKYIYRISIMLIRFSVALIGNILINYTLEVYPSNIRNQAFSFFVTVSSFGCIIFPWISLAFIHAGYSGFIIFAITSVASLYYITQLTQTFGSMCTQKLQQINQKQVLIPLQNFNKIHS